MAALGRLEVLVDRYPLSAAKQAYSDFEHGRLVGRAVLKPRAVEYTAAEGETTDSSVSRRRPPALRSAYSINSIQIERKSKWPPRRRHPRR